jgi:glycine/D-amino acid oxidase-like deaminating enzyme
VKEIALRGDQGHWRYLVSETVQEKIPKELLPIVELVSHDALLMTLKTIDTSYVAATVRTSPFKGKRMNSAKFCYKLLAYLTKQFPDRFSVYEETEIAKIQLHESYSLLEYGGGKVKAQELILCTNAYHHFSIWDQRHQRPFTKLQERVLPRIGYVAAFSSSSSERYALGFVNKNGPFQQVPFWYFSNASDPGQDPHHACVIGGPEFDLEDEGSQEWIKSRGEASLELIRRFLSTTFAKTPNTFPFFWHGWMGYTSAGLRWVGPDEDHPHLWYNLACNGIGIVPAITGGQKIAALMG